MNAKPRGNQDVNNVLKPSQNSVLLFDHKHTKQIYDTNSGYLKTLFPTDKTVQSLFNEIFKQYNRVTMHNVSLITALHPLVAPQNPTAFIGNVENKLFPKQHKETHIEQHVFRTSHCLLWEATVYESVIEADSDANNTNNANNSTFHWDLKIIQQDAVHRWLPIDWPEDASFENAFLHARYEEDRIQSDHVSHGALRNGDKNYEQIYRVLLEDNSLAWIREAVTIETLETGCWHLIGNCVDITPLQKTQYALEQVSSGANCITWYAFIEKNIALNTFDWNIHLFAEETVRRWFPVPCLPNQKYTEAMQLAVAPDDRFIIDDCSTAALLAGKNGYTCTFRLRTADGMLRWLQEDVQLTQITPTSWYAVGVNVDITIQKESEARLLHQARHDGLTDLTNHLYLQELLESLECPPGRQAALLFIDIDNFKRLNDNFGHTVGDRVLSIVAARLKRGVGRCGTVARIGGDEFAVLLPHVSNPHDVARMAEELLFALHAPLSILDFPLFLSASMGIALTQEKEDKEKLDLLRCASTAMNHAKGQGRTRYMFFDPKMDHDIREKFEIEIQLQDALQKESIQPYYQPIVDLKTGKLVALEALARWQKEDGRYIPPSRFIPIAEETGLILPLGGAILRAACQQGVRWRQKFPELRINVNVSEYQFRQPNFVCMIRESLKTTDLPPTALTLELTESILMGDTEMYLRKLEVLKAMGIQLALDDFGTGYSSLSYLSRLPVQSLKIDHSFVHSLTHANPQTAQQNEAIIRSIIALGNALQIDVTAEGIEEPLQQQRLLDLGVRYAQGYLFAYPMPPSEMDAYLDNLCLSG
jgi:diguanylate cyclase (GGDEF)-like protein